LAKEEKGKPHGPRRTSLRVRLANFPSAIGLAMTDTAVVFFSVSVSLPIAAAAAAAAALRV
jgi:hypothetical protein